MLLQIAKGVRELPERDKIHFDLTKKTVYVYSEEDKNVYRLADYCVNNDIASCFDIS